MPPTTTTDDSEEDDDDGTAGAGVLQGVMATLSILASSQLNSFDVPGEAPMVIVTPQIQMSGACWNRAPAEAPRPCLRAQTPGARLFLWRMH